MKDCFGPLARLYWRLRACRRFSRPGPRTWRRRIRAERERLHAQGVPYLELHLVCRVLVNPHNMRAEVQLQRYYKARDTLNVSKNPEKPCQR